MLRKFAPVPTTMPTANIATAVENGLKQVPEEAKEHARTTIDGFLNKVRPPSVNLLPWEHKAIKRLQQDDHILALPAVKGKATVVMNGDQHDEKMHTLSDQKTYKKLAKNLTPSHERKMNDMLLRMKKAGSIPDRLYDRSRSSAGRLPLLY